MIFMIDSEGEPVGIESFARVDFWFAVYFKGHLILTIVDLVLCIVVL